VLKIHIHTHPPEMNFKSEEFIFNNRERNSVAQLITTDYRNKTYYKNESIT